VCCHHLTEQVVCYSVCQEYKESANCRLEAQYAFQSGVDMVPLMMQEGNYKPRGWLGIIMGARLWYAFHPGVLKDDDDAALDAKIHELCNELGPRGAQVTGMIAGGAQVTGMIAGGGSASSVTQMPRSTRASNDAATAAAGTSWASAPVSVASGGSGLVEMCAFLAREQEAMAEERRAMARAMKGLRPRTAAEEVGGGDGRRLRTLLGRVAALHSAQLLSESERDDLVDSASDCIVALATAMPGAASVAPLMQMLALSEGLRDDDDAFARQLRRQFLVPRGGQQHGSAVTVLWIATLVAAAGFAIAVRR
jgi:hypothetical protein